MKTQSVSATSFQANGLRFCKDVTPEVKKAIEASPAMKRFGLFYNANISQIRMASESKRFESYSGLAISDVRPRNFLVGLFDFFTGRYIKRYAGINFSSNKQTDAGLAQVLAGMKKNSFLKMIIDKDV